MKTRKAFSVTIAMLIIIVFIAGACQPVPTETPPEPVPKVTTSIQELKQVGIEKYLGEEVVVEGVFVANPVPMLVTNLDYVLMNHPIPDQEYILLKGEAVDKLDPRELGGATIRVVAEVNTTDDEEDSDDSRPLLILVLREYWSIAELAKPYFTTTHTIHEIDPSIIATLLPARYAVLFSGGYNSSNNHDRYWNDLKFMYSTLVNTLGFPKDNIAVLYANGTAEDNDMPVNDSATLANLNDAFDDLRDATDSNDIIFVFTTNHGGGFKIADTADPIHGGHLDQDNDEQNESIDEQTYNLDLNSDGDKKDKVTWDESLYDWGGEIFDDSFHNMVDDLKFDTMVIVMEQCFSGGLILDMAQGGDRIIISAAGEHEPSWASDTNSNYDEFSYYFTSALNHAEPDGTQVDADADNDGKVSIVEAFNYAVANDSQPETPHYEDSGDGVAIPGPVPTPMPSVSDGSLGKSFSLDPP